MGQNVYDDEQLQARGAKQLECDPDDLNNEMAGRETGRRLWWES
jgi:hypothetical protein